MARDDREPIDLETVDPVTVDPDAVELGPMDDAPRYEPRRARPVRAPWIWLGAVVVGLAAWAVAAVTRDGTPRRALPPAPPPTAPATIAPQPEQITTLAPRLWAGLRGVGSGRFAVIVDDRLYLLDEAGTEAETRLVPLPEGHVTIDDQNGSSLVADTFAQTLVATASSGTRVLSARDTAFRSVTPSQWWLRGSDGTIRSDVGTSVTHEPPGVRSAAAVQAGFVGIDPPNARWVLWSGTSIETLAPSTYQLVASDATHIVFRYDCSINSCSVDIDDPTHHTIVTAFLQGVPQFATFSPDGTRLAIATTLGGVLILDTKTAAILAETHAVNAASPSLPVTWTADGGSLLVVQDHQVEIRRESDGATTSGISGTDGLEQLIALP